MKVSVIIPVYNAFQFLDKSIQSVLNQHQTGEVLLIDDRSTDGSWEKCVEWVEKDSRVKLYKNEGTKGVGAARNIGLGNATCAYIAFLDADDYYLEVRFDEDENVFNTKSEIIATSNCVEIKTEDNKEVTGLNALFINGDKIAFPQSNCKYDMYDFFKGSTLHLNGLTIKREIIENIVGFDETFKQSEDTNFIFRLLLEGKVMSTNVDKAKAVYSIHGTNTIKNISEAVYYRRMAAKKHFFSAIQNKLSFGLIMKFYISFVEYDFLWIFGKNITFKKIIKVLMLPYFTYRIFSKNDPEYYKDRKILQT